MPIEIKCSSCEKRLRVPDNAAGKRVRCPQCKAVISVPGAGGSGVKGGSAVGAGAKYHLKTEDGQTFGPVPKQELDEWLAEGRITAECQILRDGAQQWQWASDLYPQLDGGEAASPGPTPSGSSPSGFPQVGTAAPSGAGAASDNPFAFAAQDTSPTSRIGGTARAGTTRSGGKSYGKDPNALNKVKIPAILLMVVAGLDIALLLLSIVMRLAGVGMVGAFGGGDADAVVAMAGGAVGIVMNVVVIGINGFILYAAMEMQKLRSWGLALTGAILAVVPCFACCFLGIPIGIWSIIVLANADVKSAFR